MDAIELVNSWVKGRASVDAEGQLLIAAPTPATTAEKLRHAYRWIAEQALLPGTCDMQWDVRWRVAHNEHTIALAEKESYSSFVLLPILTLITCRRMVFIGAPGHGKTSMATLMGMLAGCSLESVRRAIQHGHPQLTVSDLLGSPLPSDLVKAESTQAIKVAWRNWIQMRVKIIDEYNRIPTKTQSALLSLMAEGYAEMFEQVVKTGSSAWFLTANDDLGGGTFPVIDALRDRIDLVVRCAQFHVKDLEVLSKRVSDNSTLEVRLPHDIVLTPQDFTDVDLAIRAIVFPAEVLELLGYFLGQLDFCRQASHDVESMNKTTLHLSGRRVAQVCTEDCPLDKHLNMCAQTEGGISPRTYQAIIHYAKALAYFRGQSQVCLEDLRQLVPWVLFDKLRINAQSHFFQKTENKIYLTDRIGWLRQMFDRALQQHAAYSPVRKPITELEATLTCSQTLGRDELQRVQADITDLMQDLLKRHELNGAVHQDLLRLKMLHLKCRQKLSS